MSKPPTMNNSSPTKKQAHDNDECGSSCSEDTNEVFFEMLGLSLMDVTDFVDAESNADDKQAVDRTYVTISSDAKTDTIIQPIVTPLEVPPLCSRYQHKPSSVSAFTIDNFLNKDECKAILQLSTGFHYVTEAAHTDNDGVTHVVRLQEPNKHKLSVFEHAPTVDTLWTKLQPMILPHIGSFIDYTKCGQPLGLNPRLRVLRYDASDNDVFEPHFDATTRVASDDCNKTLTSLLTVLIYLNDGGGKEFDGGETFYLDSVNPKNDNATIVTPASGKVVVFEHDLFHSSVPLTFGAKYVLRTDILFQVNDDDADVGVDIPRGKHCNNDPENVADTLLEMCHQLSLGDEIRNALDEIGLLDLTLDALFAPGVMAVRQMLNDVLDEDTAVILINAALDCR